MDVEHVRDQHRKAQPGRERPEGEAAAQDEVGADDDQSPARRDPELAHSTALQFQRRRGIGPSNQQSGGPDRQQPRPAVIREPKPGRDDDAQQAVPKSFDLVRRQYAILYEATAAREGEHPILVGVVAAGEPVVIVVDDIRASVGDEREDHGE